jgi:hypothetical protein
VSVPAGGCGDVLSELQQLDVCGLRHWVVSHFCEDVYMLLLDVWRPDSPKVREAIWAWKLHVKGPRGPGAQSDYRAFLVSLFGLDKLTALTAAAAASARQASSTLARVASTPAGAAAAAFQARAVQAQAQQCSAAAPAAPAAAAVKAAEAAAAAPEAVAAVFEAAAVARGATPDVAEVTTEQEQPSAAECEAAVTTSNLSSEPGAALTAPGPHVMALLVPGSVTGSKAGGASATSPHRAVATLQQQHLV